MKNCTWFHFPSQTLKLWTLTLKFPQDNGSDIDSVLIPYLYLATCFVHKVRLLLYDH